MELGQILSWVVGAVGLIGFFFAGKRKWWSWYINLFCQALWIVYALVTGQPAFLVTAVVYSGIFAVNAYRWTKEHLLVNKWLAKGEQEHARGEFEEYVAMASPLVAHARHELELIGEEPEVIDWYLRVIKEYTSFGHSGGSHMAIMPCLTRLLNFEPLTPLTNDPKEWYHHAPEVWDGKNGVWQNIRNGEAFSEDGGETYTLNGDLKNEDGKITRPIYTTVCNVCYGDPENAALGKKCQACGRPLDRNIPADY